MLDEIRREVGDGVSADTVADERQLLDVSRISDGLVADVAEQIAQCTVQCDREILPEAVAAVAADGEPEPILTYLTKAVPALDTAWVEGLVRMIAQKL